MKSGVYIITCQATGFTYCGSSGTVDVRLKAHKAALRKGNHHCAALQGDFHRHGENSLHFFHLYPVAEPTEYLELEKTTIRSLAKAGKCYNTHYANESSGESHILPETISPAELKPIVDAWGGPEKFAAIIDAKERTVKAWLYGERKIKPPIAKLIRSLELPRKKKGTP